MSRTKMAGVLIAALAIASMSAVAIAATTTLATGKASVHGTTKTVVVNAHGVTLYTLSGESRTSLKCTSSMCLMFWPPDKVTAGTKLIKTSAVHGTIGKLHRAGFYQVTLNGHPLYAFMGDGGKRGSAMGDGISAFGGTWHVVSP